MKITVLVDDNGQSFPSEHGMSLLVETFDKRFVVDFGASNLFIDNAKRIGVSLDVDFAVISHNHNDHNGGAKSFLELHPNTKLYLGKETRMTFGGKHFPHYRFGIERSFFKEYSNNIKYVDNVVNIDNVYIINIPYKKSELQGKNQYIQKGGLLFKDVYDHEITVCVVENKTLNIISPCSHKGVVHIIKECIKRFNDIDKINFFGGLHTKGRSEKPLNCPETKVVEIAERIKELNVNKLYLGHCTGLKAVEIIKEHNVCVEPIYVGETYEI